MKIFIASSNELEHERCVVSDVSLFLNRKNANYMLLCLGLASTGK